MVWKEVIKYDNVMFSPLDDEPLYWECPVKTQIDLDKLVEFQKIGTELLKLTFIGGHSIIVKYDKTIKG